MDDTHDVHEAPAKVRTPRGIRMDADLWEFVDGMAEAQGEGNASRLIERWVREKREAVNEAVKAA